MTSVLTVVATRLRQPWRAILSKSTRYKYYIAKKAKSKSAKATEELEEQHESQSKVEKEKVICVQVEDKYAGWGHKLKGLEVKDPAVQSLLDLRKGSKATRLENTNKERDDETDDSNNSKMDLSDDEPEGDDDAAGFRKLEALTSINVSKANDKTVHATIMTEMKKLIPTHVSKVLANYVKPRLNNSGLEILGSADAAKRRTTWFDLLLKSDIDQNENHILKPSTMAIVKKLKELIQKDELTIQDLEAAALEKFKQQYKNEVELEYHIDQLKAAVLTEAQWNTGEGDVSKPRSFESHMSKSTKPHLSFYNNDFYYLVSLSTKEKYATSLTKNFTTRCAIGTKEGKFLGYVVMAEGIKSDPEKVKSILQNTTQKVRRASVPKKHSTGQATEEALHVIKKRLGKLQTLTVPKEGEDRMVCLQPRNKTISFMLFVERKIQVPISYVSRPLQGLEICYTLMENAVLTMIHTTRNLRKIFRTYKVDVVTDGPWKKH
uniref:Reverse transcriptase domain-containing protein n=1 Tax=Tanacetum cinerariifolium TaxID=118510 RepID=A0A6L2KXL3_TANCI|nr:hypothetical protein [Tanacetum cinerariifolium]